jgi:hypothetical protein
MNKEKKLLTIIKDNLKELEIETYGERKHGNKEIPSNIHHFHIYFKNIYKAVYELYDIENQEYITQEHIKMIHGVERNIEKVLSYYEETKKNFSEILEDCYLKILGNLSFIINELDR